MTANPAEQEPLSFLPAPAACGTEFEQVEWVGTLAVLLRDGLVAGVRFNDQALLEATRAALGDRVLEVEAPAYFSVRLGTPGRRRRTPMHHVYVGNRPVVGTRSLHRLVAGLAAQLSAVVDDDPSVYTLYAEPVLTPRGLLLVPSEAQQMANVADRVLGPERFVFGGAPLVHVDRGARVVVVPEPVIRLDVAAETLTAIAPSAPEPVIAPGGYPLAGVLLGVGADAAGPLSAARATFHAARLLATPLPFGAQAALTDVVGLLGDVPVVGVSWSTEEELVRAIGEAGGA